jgi:hypothetical protein
MERHYALLLIDLMLGEHGIVSYRAAIGGP